QRRTSGTSRLAARAARPTSAPRARPPTRSTPPSGPTPNGPPPSRRRRPPQRLSRHRPAPVAAVQPPPVRYVVLDSATGYYDNAASVAPSGPGGDLGPRMLWTDRTSGAHVLFIDTTLKDQALGANLDPAKPAPWKPPLSVRRRFLRLALDPELGERPL